MAAKKIIFTAIAADPATQPEAALAACLAIIVLDINDNPVSDFRAAFMRWNESAQKFATKYKFGSEYRSVSKRVQRGDDLYGNDADVIALGKAMRKNRKPIYNNTDIDRDLFKFLMMEARVLIKDDPNAWTYIEKHISILKDVRLTQVFLSDEDEPVEIGGVNAIAAAKQMKTVFTKLTGQSPKYGYFIAPTEFVALREKNPKLFEEYAKLAKVLNKETKRQVNRLVRQSGSDKASIDAVSKALDKAGLMHNMPRGFIGGLVDEDMKFYTAEGRQLDKPPAGLVRMNPKYDPQLDDTYVLYATGYGKTGRGSDVGAGRIRTVTMNAANKVKRHAAANQFLENEKAIRTKWVGDLSKKGTKEQILAAIVELLYSTSARIGNKGNKSKGEPTYGLTTLTADHVKFKKDALLFDYVGKKLASQPATYKMNTPTSKKVGEIVRKLVDGKAKGDLVFDFRGRPVLRHAVNAYIKSLSPALKNMSAHGFRRVTGSRMARDILADHPFKAKAKAGTLKETEVNRWVKSEMEKVGKELNHRNGEKVTGMTSLKSYIDPDILVNFYKSLNLRVPSFIPAATKD